MIIKMIFLLLSLLIIVGIVACIPSFYGYRKIYIICSLTLIGNVLFPSWFFQGIERMCYITYLNLAIRILSTICLFFFIKKEDDYWIYPLLQGGGGIIIGIIGQYILITKYKIRFIWLKYKIIKNTIKVNTPIFINQFVPTLFNNTTIFFMGLVLNVHILGIFSTIKKIISIEYIFVQVVLKVFFPFLNRKREYFNKFAKISILCFLLMILLVLVIHPILFSLLKINDLSAFKILLVLSIGFFFVVINEVYTTSFLLMREDKLVMKITIFSSLVGFIGAYPLVYFFGVMGGVTNIVISQILLGILSLIYYNKLN